VNINSWGLDSKKLITCDPIDIRRGYHLNVLSIMMLNEVFEKINCIYITALD